MPYFHLCMHSYMATREAKYATNKHYDCICMHYELKVQKTLGME